MTDATMLALARAAMPEQDFQLCHSDMFGDYVQSPITYFTFDPAHNSDQAWEVLAWLLKQTIPHRYEGSMFDSWFDISDQYVGRYIRLCDKRLTVWSLAHDGTAAGLRQAVTDAAVRVLGVRS